MMIIDWLSDFKYTRLAPRFRLSKQRSSCFHAPRSEIEIETRNPRLKNAPTQEGLSYISSLKWIQDYTGITAIDAQLIWIIGMFYISFECIFRTCNALCSSLTMTIYVNPWYTPSSCLKRRPASARCWLASRQTLSVRSRPSRRWWWWPGSSGGPPPAPRARGLAYATLESEIQ